MEATPTPTRPLAFDAEEPPKAELLDKCVHCGFCLPTCPTYLLWGEEMDSPRGRIYMMKAGLEGRSDMSSEFVGHFDACLGCMACVTACPSGVEYGPLIGRTRGQIERRFSRSFGDRLFRRALFTLIPYPDRMRVMLAPLALFGGGIRTFRRTRAFQLLPARLRSLLTVAPPVHWSDLFRSTPEVTKAVGEQRLRVGLLIGCVQRLVFADVNRATVNVLSAEGCEVVAPRRQGCCGALSLHAGRVEEAKAHARSVIDTFERANVQFVIVNAAGCGSAMKEYGDLFSEDPSWAERARAFSTKVRDVSEALANLGSPRSARHPIPARVVYHDACHLAHAQGVRSAPRQLLAAIPQLEVLTPAESEICCGSAGIYNLVQPDAAAELGARKARNIASLQPDLVVTGNPGCTLQIIGAAEKLGHSWPVLHPVQLVDASIRGDKAAVAGMEP